MGGKSNNQRRRVPICMLLLLAAWLCLPVRAVAGGGPALSSYHQVILEQPVIFQINGVGVTSSNYADLVGMPGLYQFGFQGDRKPIRMISRTGEGYWEIRGIQAVWLISAGEALITDPTIGVTGASTLSADSLARYNGLGYLPDWVSESMSKTGAFGYDDGAGGFGFPTNGNWLAYMAAGSDGVKDWTAHEKPQFGYFSFTRVTPPTAQTRGLLGLEAYGTHYNRRSGTIDAAFTGRFVIEQVHANPEGPSVWLFLFGAVPLWHCLHGKVKTRLLLRRLISR